MFTDKSNGNSDKMACFDTYAYSELDYVLTSIFIPLSWENREMDYDISESCNIRKKD